MTVCALFVDANGIYPKLLGRENCWANEPDDGSDDARTYGSWENERGPVVAHPPCQLWVNMAAQNYARAVREHKRGITNRRIVLPAWYLDGSDGGCFRAALAAVREYGGVLEHPADSKAWAAHCIAPPIKAGGWRECQRFWPERSNPVFHYWVCEVWQSAYGHKARKRTWLLYCGSQQPFELNWSREPGTHQVGWFDRNKPTVSKREASATPEAFARELIRLAEWSRG